MPDTPDRIEQFRKMAEADPQNELGHFALGRALLEANKPEEALPCFSRVVQLNPGMSKAYQLKAQALLKLDRRGEAGAILTQGVGVADGRGDIVPRDEMVAMLKEMGQPVPQLKGAAAAAPVGEGQVQCRKCGKVAPKLPKPPFNNDQGRLIHQNICAACWREWIGMGTKVINELRLPLSDPQAGKVWEQHMLEFLNLK